MRMRGQHMKYRAFHPVLHTRRVAALFASGLALILALAISMNAGAQTPTATASVAKVEDQPGFSVIGVSVRTEGRKEAGGTGQIPNLWTRAMQDGTLDSIPNRADSNILAVYTDFASDQNGEFTYVLGARVTSIDKVPAGFVAVTIPAGKYAVVQTDKRERCRTCCPRCGSASMQCRPANLAESGPSKSIMRFFRRGSTGRMPRSMCISD